MLVVYEFKHKLIKLNVPQRMFAKVVKRLEQDPRVIMLSGHFK